MSQPDPITLRIGGKIYGGWQDFAVERGIDRCVSGFQTSVSERWVGQDQPWQIQPFQEVTVYIKDDLVLTGYVQAYRPSFDARSHTVHVSGSSRTIDLVECDIDLQSGQFSGYTLVSVARAVAAVYGIEVIDQSNGLAEMQLSNVNQQRCETAFTLLERLGRLAGVLLTDNEKGNLVLTTAGDTRAASALVQGENVQAASAHIDVSKRFSNYLVKGQAGIGYGATKSWNKIAADGSWDGYTAETSATANAPAGKVQTQMRAEAIDSGVPRFRLHVTYAESQLTLTQMQQRANWQKQFGYGRSIRGTITVQGFRQSDGKLWTPNQIVSCTVPWLEIDADLLVVKVRYAMDSTGGAVTHLDVGPIEGYTPDPGQVKAHKSGKHGRGRKGGGGFNPAGFGGV